MTVVVVAWLLMSFVATLLLVTVVWRWVSRVWALPCPTLFAWALERPIYDRLAGTATTLERIGLRPGQRVLEIGPGPGRILIPAAKRVLPGGEVVGIDLQAGMIDRLKARAAEAKLTNVSALHGDGTQAIVAPESFDVVLLITALGEIPDRAAVLAQCYRALRPGGILSVTEMLPDPHYQSQATVQRFAEAAGFQWHTLEGGMWLYTANFAKPTPMT